MAESPTLTETINQSFFIEALNGAKQPISYLDRFPDAIYSKSPNSVLVALLYGLLGPAGLGSLREDALKLRLMMEEAGVQTADLDALYNNPFGFARLALETYDIDASAGLLNAQDRALVLKSDASFRNRAITFLHAIRAGGTPLGLSLAAESGLNHPVDVIENYKALFDQFADSPLGIEYQGTTLSLNEIVVLPRQDRPENSVQSLQITGEPTSGYFTLSFPAGPDYQVIPIGTSSGSTTVTVPSTAGLQPGTFVSVTSTLTSTAFNAASPPVPTSYGVVDQILSPTQLTLIYAPGDGSAGSSISFGSTRTVWGYLGSGESQRLPYNASSEQVLAALISIPILGNNVDASGGPLPDTPIVVTFQGQLSDADVPVLQFNIDIPNDVAGIGGASPQVGQVKAGATPLSDANGVVSVSQVGESADGQDYAISPIDEHAMTLAVDRIRPMTSFVTTGQARARTKRKKPQKVGADQSYVEVIRYEKGRRKVPWQPLDPIHWIEAGIEHEAPRPFNTKQPNYIGFHNVKNIMAYDEDALNDTNYELGSVPLDITYWNSKLGLYLPGQVALYPFLAAESDPNQRFTAEKALAPSPEYLTVTNHLYGQPIINWEYPQDYLTLPGIKQLPTKQKFWSSKERGFGDDYLEIDLGTTQAVNYVTFEASKKPYIISVHYDVLDQAPARHFVPVTVVPDHLAPSTNSLTYDATATNPWQHCEITFTNSVNQMIYARFLRIGFHKNPGHTPLQRDNLVVPFGIEVRNLRIGRRAHGHPPGSDIVTVTS